jgi:hypothetical protein
MIAYNLIHGDADRKCHTTFDGSAIYFLCELLGRLRINDGATKLAKVDDSRTRDALGNETSQGKVYNFGCFGVLGAHITAR